MNCLAVKPSGGRSSFASLEHSALARLGRLAATPIPMCSAPGDCIGPVLPSTRDRIFAAYPAVLRCANGLCSRADVLRGLRSDSSRSRDGFLLRIVGRRCGPSMRRYRRGGCGLRSGRDCR